MSLLVLLMFLVCCPGNQGCMHTVVVFQYGAVIIAILQWCNEDEDDNVLALSYSPK